MNNGPEKIPSGKRTGLASSGAGEYPPGQDRPASLQRETEEAPNAQLEAVLRHALARVDPPSDLADRILDRISTPEELQSLFGAQSSGKLLHWPQSRVWITWVVAAALLLGVFGGGIVVRRVREQQRRIVQATQQFQTTERITVRALAQAREQLHRAGVPLTLD